LNAALAAFEQARAIWRELGLRPNSLLTLIGLGAVQRGRGRLAAALRTFEEVLAIAQECGDRQSEYYGRENVGFVLTSQGRYAQARATLEIARTQAQELGVPRLVSATLRALGALYRAIFAVEQALACCQEAEATTGGIGHKGDEAKVQHGLGLAWLMLGDCEEARRCLGRAAALAQEAQSPLTRLVVSHGLADLDLATGVPAAALSRATEVAEKAAALGWVELVAQARQQQGKALLALDRTEEAIGALRQALGIADEVGLPSVQWQTLAALGRAYRTQGQLPAARDALAWAGSIVETLSENIDDEALQAGFLAAGPVHRLREDQAALGRQVRVRLARPDAPTGQPLTDDERVEVVWTVDAGEPDAALLASEGKVALRRARLLRLVEEAREQGAVPTQDDLARALGVTRRTIRSDLAALRQQGHQVRTWAARS
jgi:tetratricopeptide (TPR) repeat protein